ncbi:MAG: hypothetical protein JST26_13270 [Bacteroidetes bacterium]|nr:hypothetical protein [Bacteroidota bacterium]
MEPEQKTFKLKVFHPGPGKLSEHTLFVEKGLHSTTRNVIWNTKFGFNDKIIEGRNEYFLSNAINDIRKTIEPEGFRLLVRCSDLDAAQSGMLSDMSAGTLMYKLRKTPGDTETNSYNVLDESTVDEVATLEEQKNFRALYFNTN